MNDIALKHRYVFIVLELGKKDACIHGVYTTRKIANDKRDKLSRKQGGYLCVLKKTIQGPVLRPLFTY